MRQGCAFSRRISFDVCAEDEEHIARIRADFEKHRCVLQRISVHPANRAIELTPRMWKSLFADDPLRSDLGPLYHDFPPP